MTYPVFTNGTVLPASDLNAIGLWKITSVDLTGSTVTVDNCFSSSFTNYKIVWQGTANVSSAIVQMVFRTGGANVTTAAYNFAGYYIATNGTSTINGESSASQAFMRGGLIASGMTALNTLEIGNPKATATATWMGTQQDTYVRISSGYFNGTNSFDGFQLSLGAYAFTSGKLVVYGYRD